MSPELLNGQPVPPLPDQALGKLAEKHNLLAYLREDDLDAMAASRSGKAREAFLVSVGGVRGFVGYSKIQSTIDSQNFGNIWAIDELEHVLTDDKLRSELARSAAPDQLQALDRVLETLDQRSAEAKYSRKLRKLKIPREVNANYWGARSSSKMPMGRQQGSNEFACVLADLKESVKLYVQGEDFSSYPYKRITLVPPPMLTKLEKDEYVPAYQYHRVPADGVPQDLKGRKQERLGQPISLTGGTSRIDIAYGSDLVLRGELDKDLDQAIIRYRSNQKPAAGAAGDAGAGKVEELAVGGDRRTISKRFDNITRHIEFDFEFTDSDHVRSLRHVVIQPIDDKTPDVNVAVEIIRKTNQGYMCTPQAMIPFSGSVRDDVGLQKIEYALSYSRVESMQVLGIRAAVVSGVIGAVNLAPPMLFAAPGVTEYLSRLTGGQQAVTVVDPIVLKSFQELTDEKNRDYRYGKAMLDELLRRPNGSSDESKGGMTLDQIRKDRLISLFEIKPNVEWLDLQSACPRFKRGSTTPSARATGCG